MVHLERHLRQIDQTSQGRHNRRELLHCPPQRYDRSDRQLRREEAIRLRKYMRVPALLRIRRQFKPHNQHLYADEEAGGCGVAEKNESPSGAGSVIL